MFSFDHISPFSDKLVLFHYSSPKILFLQGRVIDLESLGRT